MRRKQPSSTRPLAIEASLAAVRSRRLPETTGPPSRRCRHGRAAATAILVALWALAAPEPVPAQSAFVADGLIESTRGGFRFPDGSILTSAASATICSPGDFLYCYGGPPATLDVGDCRPGARACEPAGTGFGACVGEILPAAEICDGRDNDCDGAIDPGGICDGEVVITEILYDSSGVPDESFEWFEVHNPNPHPVNLLGWSIRDAEGSGQQVVVVQADVLIAAGGYAVLCHNADPASNGGVFCDYEYGAFSLSNSADEVILVAGGVVIDAVAYDEGSGWPAATSGSLNLDPAAVSTAANDLAASWCNSPDGGPEIPNGDEGTPGAANVPCS